MKRGPSQLDAFVHGLFDRTVRVRSQRPNDFCVKRQRDVERLVRVVERLVDHRSLCIPRYRGMHSNQHNFVAGKNKTNGNGGRK